jgi:uncharacterized protein YndB with AHSA1/START domain
MTKGCLKLVRTFPTTPGRLFDAWMIRENWQQWIGPEGIPCTVVEMNPVVGGTYLLHMMPPGMRLIRVAGTYKILDRPDHIEFTWESADGSTWSYVSLTFRSVDEGTEMTLHHHGLGTPENCESHGEGWQSAFNKLERYASGGMK